MLERKETREQLSALPSKHTPRKVTAEQLTLSQEALSDALKMSVSPTLQSTGTVGRDICSKVYQSVDISCLPYYTCYSHS